MGRVIINADMAIIEEPSLDGPNQESWKVRLVSWGGDYPPPDPEAPSNLVATSNGINSISLTWDDNSDDETGFVIERSLDGVGSWSEILTPVANSTSALNTGLDPETEYFYRIKSVIDWSETESGWSNIDSATTDPPPEPEEVQESHSVRLVDLGGLYLSTKLELTESHNVRLVDFGGEYLEVTSEPVESHNVRLVDFGGEYLDTTIEA